MKNVSYEYKITVSGNSMYPCLKDGDVVRVRSLINETIEIGDVIVYKKFKDHLTIHRVVEKCSIKGKRHYFKTKGDNNDTIDNYIVIISEILGVLVM